MNPIRPIKLFVFPPLTQVASWSTETMLRRGVVTVVVVLCSSWESTRRPFFDIWVPQSAIVRSLAHIPRAACFCLTLPVNLVDSRRRMETGGGDETECCVTACVSANCGRCGSKHCLLQVWSKLNLQVQKPSSALVRSLVPYARQVFFPTRFSCSSGKVHPLFTHQGSCAHHSPRRK